MERDQTPAVTIVITTRNEAHNIGACLASIAEQTVPRQTLEIIVVDNNSDDGTVEAARPYVDAVYTLGPERSAQRNFGVAQARAPYVLYLDADMRLSSGVIAACLDAARNDPEITGIFIPEIVVGSGYWIAVRNFERSFYDATPIDAVRFIKRNVFLSLGGFDGTLCGPEDWDMDRRLAERGRLYLISEPLYHDEGAFNFHRYLRKKAYYTRSFDTYRRKWHNDAIVRKQLGFYYRFIGVFTEKGKWRRLVIHPLLTVGMYSLRFLVGLSYCVSR